MKSRKNRKSLRKQRRRISRKTNHNLVQNYILEKPQKHQVILNKNGIRTNSENFQDELEDITSRAFKYAHNAKILGNELFLQELNN
jgi:hypothetical protein